MNSPRSATPGVAVLSAKQYAGFAVSFLALALYGSLVPFHYQPVPLDETLTCFRAVLQAPLVVQSRSDWAVNILLFVPLSYLVMAAVCVDRPWWVGLGVALVVIPGCSALSAAMEWTQLSFAGRTSSVNDIVAESTGGLLGAVLWLAGGQRFTEWARGLWSVYGASNLAARLLPGYVILLILVHLLPLDLTISPVAIYHKYREGQVALLPFTAPRASVLEGVQKQLGNVAFFLPVGLLAAHLPGGTGPQARHGWRVLGLGLALAGLIEFLQLFVVSRGFDGTDIVTGSLAILGGWGAVWSLRRGAFPGLRPREPRCHDSLAERRLWMRAALGVTWLGVLLFVHWQPFDVTFDAEFLAGRLQRLALVPFADYQRGTESNAFDQVVHKTLLFVPVGVLLAPRPRRAEVWAVLAALCLAAGLETGQLLLPTRYASVTDVLVEGFGAWMGIVWTARLRTALPVHPSRGTGARMA